MTCWITVLCINSTTRLQTAFKWHCSIPQYDQMSYNCWKWNMVIESPPLPQSLMAQHPWWGKAFCGRFHNLFLPLAVFFQFFSYNINMTNNSIFPSKFSLCFGFSVLWQCQDLLLLVIVLLHAQYVLPILLLCMLMCARARARTRTHTHTHTRTRAHAHTRTHTHAHAHTHTHTHTHTI